MPWSKATLSEVLDSVCEEKEALKKEIVRMDHDRVILETKYNMTVQCMGMIACFLDQSDLEDPEHPRIYGRKDWDRMSMPLEKYDAEIIKDSIKQYLKKKKDDLYRTKEAK